MATKPKSKTPRAAGLTKTEAAKDRKAVRGLEHWLHHGNTTANPGGRFKEAIDFIRAVERLTYIAAKFLAGRKARR